MGRPAARLTDMHVCPMATGLVPHVGGPISGPCCPTVLIGGLPAARVSDLLVCVGPPDVIAMGSTGVFIGGLPAARLADPTVHGGTIVMGWPTVLIGEVGGGGAGGAGGGAAGGGAAGGGGGGGGGGGWPGDAAAAVPGPGQAYRTQFGPKVAAALAVSGALGARRTPELSATPDFGIAHSTPAIRDPNAAAMSHTIEAGRAGIKGAVTDALIHKFSSMVRPSVVRGSFKALRNSGFKASISYGGAKSAAAVVSPVLGIVATVAKPVISTYQVVRETDYDKKVEKASQAFGDMTGAVAASGAMLLATKYILPIVVVASLPVLAKVAAVGFVGGVVGYAGKVAWDKWGAPRFKKSVSSDSSGSALNTASTIASGVGAVALGAAAALGTAAVVSSAPVWVPAAVGVAVAGGVFYGTRKLLAR